MSENDESRHPVVEDFLLVAGMMEGFSLPVIAAALSYKKEAHISALESKMDVSKRDKIAQLFVNWNKDNYKGKCTWDDLKKCLRQLNNEGLLKEMDIIRNRRGKGLTCTQ